MNNTILVSYDLIAPGKDYSRLWEHLRSYSSWTKPLESVWLLKTQRSATEVRDNLKSHIDKNDKLLVIDVTSKAAAWHNLGDKINQWIKNNL